MVGRGIYRVSSSEDPQNHSVYPYTPCRASADNAPFHLISFRVRSWGSPRCAGYCQNVRRARNALSDGRENVSDQGKPVGHAAGSCRGRRVVCRRDVPQRRACSRNCRGWDQNDEGVEGGLGGVFAGGKDQVNSSRTVRCSHVIRCRFMSAPGNSWIPLGIRFLFDGGLIAMEVLATPKVGHSEGNLATSSRKGLNIRFELYL